MKKNTAGKWILCGVLISVLISVFFCRSMDGHQIQSAAELTSRNGFLYGLDITEDYYRLFRTDMSTGYSRTVIISRFVGEDMVTLSDLAAGKDGQVYFHYVKDGENQEDWIGVCNFKRGRIRKAFDFPDSPDQYYAYLFYMEDHIFLEMMDQDNRLHEWILDEETLCLTENGVYSMDQVENMILTDACLWEFDKTGNIYIRTKGETQRERVFTNDGSQIGMSNCRYTVWNGDLHFLNLESGKNYVLESGESGGKLQECETCVDYTMLTEKLGYVSDLDLAEPGTVMGYTWTEDRCVPFLYGEKNLVVSQLLLSPSDMAALIIQIALLCMALFVSVYAIIWLIRRLNGGVFPLIAQMLFVSVPLFVIICWGSSVMLDGILVYNLMEAEKDALAQAAVFYRNSLDKDDPILGMEGSTENSLVKIRLSSGYYDISKGEDKAEGDIYLAISYACRDGEVYSLSTGYNLSVPLSYMAGKDVYEAVKAAAERKKTVSLVHQDVDGNWLSAFTPYMDENGNVTAVIELREDINQSLSKIWDPMAAAAIVVFGSFGLLAAAIFLIVVVSLRPLGSLSRAAMEISKGKLDIRLKEGRCFTEIGRISEVFNQMSFNISRNMRELAESGRKYAMFIPSQFLGYLGKESILETAHGDYAEEDFVVMEISSSDFGAVAGSITGQQTFETINRALEQMVPVLEQHGGMITGFNNAGALSIYKEDGDSALAAAVNVIQSMNQERLRAGEKILGYTAGICFGPVRLGIIGAGSRSSATAMSLNCQFAGMLQRMAVKYGAGILITGEAAKHVRNFESSYHYRILGYVFFSSKDVVDIVYDVYDGDDMDVRQRKQETKELFEQGVQLYVGAQFLEARNCFVKVLYENRDDLAARQYFSFCEMYLNGEKDKEICHYIEVF